MKQEEGRTNNIGSEEQLARSSLRDLGAMLYPYVRRLWVIRRIMLIINGSVFILAIIYQLLFTKPYFESSVTILPDYGSKSTSGSLGGLAALAGVSLGEGANSAEIYRNLLGSETVIEPVVNSRYQSSKFKDSVNLQQYFELRPDDDSDPALQERKMFLSMYKKMSEVVIKIDVEPMTRILKLTATMPEAHLSSAVANNMVESLDKYVRTKRKSNASMQRTYLERRASDIKDSLGVSEENLKVFLSRNRQVNQSPLLQMEQSRLTRQVQILQTVYIELARQLELAKIDEIRDAPIINVREWARDPVQKAGPRRLIAVIVISAISFLLTILYFLFYEKVKSQFNNTITSGNEAYLGFADKNRWR